MTGSDLALHGDDERALAHLMARARIISKMPGLKKELIGNPDAVAAVMISLEGYGLPTTAQGINTAFDWIEGKAEMSAQTYQALAHKNGYDIIPLVRTAERAVARVERAGRPPIDVEFTLDDARRAHRLDEWVEEWKQENGSWRKKGSMVVRVDGEPVNQPWPDWAARLVQAGRVKRYDAWWNYRTDMLWKSAAKRAVKLAAPHVLLGVTSDESAHETVWEPADDGQVVEAQDPNVSETPPPGYEPDDDEITDAELVEDPPASAPRPAPEPPQAQAEAAEPARAGVRPAPAGEQLWGEDEEPFE